MAPLQNQPIGTCKAHYLACYVVLAREEATTCHF